MARNVKQVIRRGDMVTPFDARASGLVWGWCDMAMDSRNDTRSSGIARGANSRLNRAMGAGRESSSSEPANEVPLRRVRPRMGLGHGIRSSAGALLIGFAGGAFAD